jgi:dephospho-CoA kinase
MAYFYMAWFRRWLVLIKIGVTGKPGSGKSLVCRMFSEYPNTYILNTDLINRDVLIDHDEEILNLLKLKFFSIGSVREQVFTDPEKLDLLENFVKPYILEKLEKIWEYNSIGGENLISITEVPLLYEAGWEKHFDKIVVVHCDEEERRLRLHYRGWTEDMIKMLSSRFTSIDFAEPHYRIGSLCSLVDLRKKVKALYDLLAYRR